MGIGNNLFQFAPRELSQSAFWAWVLKSLDPDVEASSTVSDVGATLLRDLDVPVPQSSMEVDTEHSLGGNGGRVDIYAKIDGTTRVLIEHKVTAPIRGDQLSAYREAVDDRVQCLFLSTAYDLQKRRGDLDLKGWEARDAFDVLDLLGSVGSGHPVVAQYQEWLDHVVTRRVRREEKALSQDVDDREDALTTVPGQWRFMQRVTDTFSHDGRQYGARERTDGSPYTEFRFVEDLVDDAEEEYRDALFYRIDNLTNGPVFRLKQWQRDPSPNWDRKKTRREQLRELWNESLDEADSLEWDRPTNRGRQSSAVARISLRDYTASALADELAAVHQAFVNRVRNELGWRVGRACYSYECRECEDTCDCEREISDFGREVFAPSCPDCGSSNTA